MRLSLGAWEIREHVRTDAPALVKYANNRQVSRQLRDRFPFPYTAADAAAFLDRVFTLKPRTAFAVATPQELIGGIGLLLGADVYRRSAEIGYWLAEPYWGQGIATRAARAFTDWAFASFDLERIFAGVFEGNLASVRVLEKSGFELEGRQRRHVTKDGRTFDQFMYARLRR